MSDKPHSIAVIGGGASATLFLAHLFSKEALDRCFDIHIFDQSGTFGRGLAYSTKRIEHLLNVRAAKMSALENDPEHFVRWLKKKNIPYGPQDFVPRMIYGDYLEELWTSTIQKAVKQGCSIELSHETVVKIEKNEQAPYKIFTQNAFFSAANIILATGNAKSVRVAGAENLDDMGGYINFPWSADFYHLANANEMVILGTGLSMVDTVMSLNAVGYQGKITAISRHGLVPHVHKNPEQWPQFINEQLPKTVLGTLKIIKSQIKEARRQGLSWQAVIDSLRPATNNIYLGWSQIEKKKFKRLAPFWNVHRHRMAPDIDVVIKRWREQGQLVIQKDKIIDLTLQDKHLNVRGARQSYSAPYVINCLGYGPSALGSEFIEDAGVFALGPVLAGRYGETTAIPEIREQAAQMAAALLNSPQNKAIKAYEH